MILWLRIWNCWLPHEQSHSRQIDTHVRVTQAPSVSAVVWGVSRISLIDNDRESSVLTNDESGLVSGAMTIPARLAT